jgi:tRNA (adenine22-N1)-methyltransferase
MNGNKTIGKRLEALFDLITLAHKKQPYDAIWDCCCDHGYLGLKILNQKLCSTLYFVDQVPHIMQQLTADLSHYPSDRYQTITADAGTLSLPINQRHLIILAGVGGERIIEIINNLNTHNEIQQIDYLLCPTTAQFDLREYLVTTDFKLVYEAIVSEKGHDYEILLIRHSLTAQNSDNITLIGQMWEANNPYHLRYRQKLIKHYQKQMQGERNKAQRAKKILDHYQSRPSDTTH